MLKLFARRALFVVALALAPAAAQATPILFTATLTGSQEVPPNASTAMGFGSVLLDDVLLTITVNESWTGLTAPATASHIHGPGAPGIAAPVIFGFADVPAATSGAIPQQVSAITLAQIAQLENGLFYMNVHDVNFPGGEIRGQLHAAPEPMTLALLAFGSIAACWTRRRGRRS